MWKETLAVSLGVLPVFTILYHYIQRRKKSAFQTRISKCIKKDVVYLHQFPRKIAKQVPNMSPFAMKLELWLRIKNVKHEVVESTEWSQKGQSPFVVLNGEEIADTNFIIKRLTSHFRLDKTEGLEGESLGAARAFIHLVEGSLVWTYFIWRYTMHADLFAKVFRMSVWPPLAKFIRFNVKRGMRNRCYQVGIARHSPEEIFEIAYDDLLAIERFLGEKPYMCGQKPTSVDCSVFGHLSQIVYVLSLPYPHRTFIAENCPRILKYMDRIKEKYWPDWEQITGKGEFVT